MIVIRLCPLCRQQVRGETEADTHAICRDIASDPLGRFRFLEDGRVELVERFRRLN